MNLHAVITIKLPYKFAKQLKKSLFAIPNTQLEKWNKKGVRVSWKRFSVEEINSQGDPVMQNNRMEYQKATSKKALVLELVF